MSRRAHTRAVTLLLLGVGLLVPSAAWALTGAQQTSGGGGLGGSGQSTPTPSSGTTTTGVQPGNATVQASGNGITVTTHASAMLRNQLSFSGHVASSAAGQIVEIERRGRQTGWTWRPTTHGSVGSGGSFSAVWPANHIGRFSIRAVVAPRAAAITRAAPASPTLTVTVYRPAIATQYGPGFYGSRTACGQILRKGTLGVANRTLKCGTPVAILWHGRTIVVPVIDRGPYANHADWDLTEATGRALGLAGTATIGAVSVPSHG
ncbi:MAG TPA: septal ring lytic transglycosylase RlpA family protein [Solirubrobacteraceae bacterium]